MNIIVDDDLLNFVGKQESQFLIQPSHLSEEVKERFINEKFGCYGTVLPWSKTHSHIRLRESEVSLWTGINGHGKSGLLGQVCAWALKENWLIASMEMPPSITVQRMIRQIAGAQTPEEYYIEKILKWMDEKLWLYDQTDSVSSDRILALVRYAKTLGIKHIVIDSLIKCGIAKRDMEGQAAFVDHLCWLAKNLKLHIHLVHHMRKSESEKQAPGKFDIRGASEIIDLVDNIFIVYRNKKKEESSDIGDEIADTYLTVAKQRNYPWEGQFKLWFDKESNQYTSNSTRKINHWLHHEMLA
jgi:twinkle protein